MSIRSSLATAGLALILAGAFGSSAFAVKPQLTDGQKPPAEQQDEQKADKKEEPKCVINKTDFKQDGSQPVFEIALENSCNIRLKCTIDVSVMGAKGIAQGHSTLILGPAAKGQTTRKVYALKVKSLGGMASMSQECKKI